ncbi:MAG: cryptochrome/photolyase family protein [Alphaproteobacteria bacterium]|nr:cryptochrome/photolyase family protein [Hyphomonas sp.]MBR9806828.1 cryptochrome/photolyase family protein [Alphaproteobacteria bacterium]|tara:strand:+ start:2900 stop:4423 length:1524 start_codon:yes stop_codon:yes gene_type:complete
MANLILLLGDQLTHDISSLREGNPDEDRVLMFEVMEEATYAWHHKKKIAFLFSAMRHFAESLKEEGWTVDYVHLDDEENAGSFTGEVDRALKRLAPEALLVTSAGEYRVQEMIEGWEERFGLPVRILEDDRFICSREEFRDWAEGRKQLRMEYFYREMRKKTGLLMEDDGEPAGGEWNFDQENRKPAKQDLFMPTPHQTEPDKITCGVLDMVSERFEDHPGKLDPFWFGVTHEDAQAALDQFIAEALPCFGDYQDAMLKGEKFLYHSLLSLYINAGLLDPLEVCRRVDKAYRDGKAPLNSAEGFIRQILGWREYVRGVYWLKMPDYVGMNFLEAKRELPDFYWTGDTDMACLKAAIDQTLEEAYAHHIQRLMVTGNFALLAGIDPKAVHEWYLAVYADAYEWVELPNTLGMSQFADGGLLGSKPYAASGNYINKMSDYCSGCKYDVKQKTGEGSCPFNSLYWDFLVRNRSKLEDNPRMAQMYSTWERMSDDKQEAYLETAKAFLNQL